MKFNIKLLNILKRRKRYLSFFLDIEPTAKKTKQNKGQLQKVFIDEMKTWGNRTINGKLALEITAYTNKRTPPRVENFAKNIIDIMHKKEILINPEEAIYLPFIEDKFIKYLKVKYNFIDGTSSIHINIKPFSSFISDIHFVAKELNSMYKMQHKDVDCVDEYLNLIKNKERIINRISQEAYESLLKMTTLDAQKEICDRMSITHEMINQIYPHKLRYFHKFADIYRNWSSILLDTPIRIHLPGIPLKNGAEDDYKGEYRDNIKQQMRQFLAKHPIFNQIQSPIVITTFYMPPKKKKRNYKDIDNIMLEYIMPAMNEVFNPPISMFNMSMEEKRKKGYHKPIPIPESLNGSAIGYEVLELPYNFSQSETGFLRVGFKIENIDRSIMSYIDSEIDKYIKENQYVD
jgi:Holliday junction resolvase RusA-like endonuclease